MYDVLIIIDQDHAITVAWADDPEDWVVRFDKQPGFPALKWAERMVKMYNRGDDRGESPAENISDDRADQEKMPLVRYSLSDT